ncbi:hypothetical protein [uncultured Microscilla sp.]|uniref:hypothetical protein n=1 Tax=uncultured Microscilla sp. TaxID=432653 RepID=UPI002638C898|nr:hypothetical protein [uncultured Microscilla sp.]
MKVILGLINVGIQAIGQNPSSKPFLFKYKNYLKLPAPQQLSKLSVKLKKVKTGLWCIHLVVSRLYATIKPLF